jgi:NAD(P)-dependent dehydrogenase (short-subunit alcohol dehydrogenase family)
VTWSPPPLDGTVTLVTGSTRGVGRGIVLALGDAGATVYVTGRSTVDEASDEVTARGGRGVGVRVDHSVDAEVVALFDRVLAENDRLDVVVANAWGGYADHDHTTFAAPLWEQPLSRWQTMYESGLRPTFTTVRAAAQAMSARGSGLIVVTGGWDAADEYLGNLYYDVYKAASARIVAALAHELRAYGVAVVGVVPGFTRTEAVVAAFAAAGTEPPEVTHSPEYVGRAVAHVAADPGALELTGRTEQVTWYASRYAFTDLDGRRFDAFRMPPENRI